MKKITLLLSFVVYAMFMGAQTNLLVNPSFETWEDGKPTGWILPTNTYATVSKNTTLFNDGISSIKVTADPNSTGGTYSINQTIAVTEGKTYALSLSYYIETGDNTDARIWCNLKKGTTSMVEDDLVATGLYPKLRGPGAANSNSSLYLPDIKGSWQTYTTEFTIPEGVDAFIFEFRTYKKPAIVNWDKMSLTEKTTGLTIPSSQKLELIVSGKNLLIKNVAEGSEVEIFSAVGSKVMNAVVENGKVSIANLKAGMYVVRSGKLTQKIRL